ncbi:MAG: Holliday junction branch migration protein RuvA [Acidimicrobiales bacterium]|nr:Holliday junction branch migration protein RuvA [Acidimicrobiales bacterium]
MIGSLRGVLLDRSISGEILIEVSGVGYRVQAGPATAAKLGDMDSEVFVWVHHHIREDADTLYGFSSKSERDCFEALLGAHGVGPSLGLAILSVHPPVNLARVLADDDVAALCLVPGVGKKTAARLLIELKSKLDVPLGESAVPSAGQSDQSAQLSTRSDVRNALSELGYSPEEIAEATRELGDGDAGVLLKEALRRLAGAR